MLERGLGQLGRGAMSSYQGGNGCRDYSWGKQNQKGPSWAGWGRWRKREGCSTCGSIGRKLKLQDEFGIAALGRLFKSMV